MLSLSLSSPPRTTAFCCSRCWSFSSAVMRPAATVLRRVPQPVRQMERNYYAQILDPPKIDVNGPRAWPDLRAPLFLITFERQCRVFTPQLLLDFFYFLLAWVVRSRLNSQFQRVSTSTLRDHCQRRLRPGAGLADHRDRHRLLCGCYDLAKIKERRLPGEVHF